MPLPSLYSNRKIQPKSDGYMNPGYDQYDEGLAYPTVEPPTGGGDPWGQPLTTSSGFGGSGTDPSVGGPGFSMPTIPGVDGGNGSGIDWNNLIKQGTGGMSPQQMAYLAATTGMAGKQWNDAGKIEDRFNQIADDADYLHPDRVSYAGQLANLMADPSSIEKDPAYQFRLSQGLNTLGPQQAAKGGGYGNAAKSMIDYAGNAASQELDSQEQRLANLAGFQFDQGRTAADLRSTGLTGRIGSENAALGTLGFGLQNAFGQQGTGININNGTGNGGSNGSGNGGGGGGLPNPLGLGNGGNAGNGSWNQDGTYRTPSGQNIDVAKLSQLAMQGNPQALEILRQISGGSATDQNIRDLTTGDIRDGSGTDTGDPYNPGGGYEPGGGYVNPDGGWGGGNTYDPGWDGDSFSIDSLGW
jgi:hypothetical protein